MKDWQIYLLILIILEFIADIFVKSFSLNGKLYLALVALLFYVLANTSYIISMKINSNLTLSANIFSVGSGLIAAIVGIGFYNEIVLIKQIIGIFLGIISLILLL